MEDDGGFDGSDAGDGLALLRWRWIVIVRLWAGVDFQWCLESVGIGKSCRTRSVSVSLGTKFGLRVRTGEDGIRISEC